MAAVADGDFLNDTLSQTWAQREISPGSLATDETARAEPGIDPDETRRISTGASSSRERLPALGRGSDPTSDIELGEVLGEGGMGVVFSATQKVLGRTVAVKTLRPDVADPALAIQLLREGRVTGLLEHPNVVPVYTLGSDEQGLPVIVMKRIDGTPWSTMVESASHAERITPAFLRKHLGILVQVARAIHFTHSMGFLHRDIKPDNVMIGAFGEVYVVDWGIAVSLSARTIASVPRASSVRTIEGTPVYMSPEMAAGAGELLGPASDVYLLGATLHHVLTGRPPHDSDDIRDVLERAFASTPPTYEERVPDELAEIARRAMARRPAQRYASAEELAQAIDAFLLHWSSHELTMEGEQRMAELRAKMRDLEPHEELDRLFHEARFAFDQALRSWSESPQAAQGRQRLLELMAEIELRRGAPRAALALLRQLEKPPAGLKHRVGEAVERLEMLERDFDPRLGLKQRLQRIYLGVASWALCCIVAGYVSRNAIFEVTHEHIAMAGVVFLVGNLISIATWQRTTVASAANMTVAGSAFLVFLVSTVTYALGGALDVSLAHTTAFNAFLTAALWTAPAFQIGRSWASVSVSHAVVAPLAWLLPGYHFEIYGVLTALGFLVTARLMVQAYRSDAPPPSSRVAASRRR